MFTMNRVNIYTLMTFAEKILPVLQTFQNSPIKVEKNVLFKTNGKTSNIFQ